jgi:Co/Zn/Cd efflux system component
MGVLLHVLCDAANNLGVIASALVIWLAKYDGRYYADPGVSMGIAIMIMVSSVPLSMFSPPSPILNNANTWAQKQSGEAVISCWKALQLGLT